MINWSKAVNDLTSLSVGVNPNIGLKDVNDLSLSTFLKGHPAKAIKREHAGIKVLKRCGIPAPNVVYEDERCIVTEDVGPNLQDIAVDKRIGVAEKGKIFSAAGKILAALHKQRYAHGFGPTGRLLGWDRYNTIRSGVF